jgi:2-polyprenyl-3-methyl-5-hydroxy-6-metoxy-1,4-benzoquinol methylase
VRKNNKLKQEAEAFDKNAAIRVEKGFVPDLRNLQKVTWFYNNPWREPEFAKIRWVPVMNSIITKSIETGKRVLEVGCGTGMLSLELARNGLDVTGIDLSPKSIEIANEFKKKNTYLENFGSLEYICGDFLSLEIEEKAFDSVVFFRSLHHFPNVNEVTGKVRRLLVPDGRILLCEPIHNRFNYKAAEFALILRMLLPTWESYETKLDKEWNESIWKKRVEEIYDEYVYKGDHHQSIMDKSTDSDEEILSALKPYFITEYVKYHDGFINHIIGGLRGESRFLLARFLQFLDNYMVEKEAIPPTSITIFAIKKDEGEKDER